MLKMEVTIKSVPQSGEMNQEIHCSSRVSERKYDPNKELFFGVEFF